MSASARFDPQLSSAEAELARLAEAYRRVAMRELGRHWAHALVQPIAAIHNYFEAAAAMLQARGRSVDPAIELVGHIGHQSERVVERMRALRNALPELPLRQAILELNSIARRAVCLSAPELAGRSIDVRWSLTEENPCTKGDVILLTQALMNLIVNGLEAMDTLPSHGRQLWLGSQVQGGEVCISIGDSGPGVPEELGQRIFEPLFSTKDAALGMGLPVARAIAEAHGGRLRLERNAARGALFRFCLPALESAT